MAYKNKIRFIRIQTHCGYSSRDEVMNCESTNNINVKHSTIFNTPEFQIQTVRLSARPSTVTVCVVCACTGCARNNSLVGTDN